jgi:hypothetical protein
MKNTITFSQLKRLITEANSDTALIIIENPFDDDFEYLKNKIRSRAFAYCDVRPYRENEVKIEGYKSDIIDALRHIWGLSEDEIFSSYPELRETEKDDEEDYEDEEEENYDENGIKRSIQKKIRQLSKLSTIEKGYFTKEEGKFLSSIKIPDNIQTIGKEAFSYFWNLKNVIIGNGVTKIEPGAFEYCNLENLIFGSNLSNIGRCAFWNSHIRNIEIPDGVTSIGDCAFYDCIFLKDVTIPASVTSIGDGAFRFCHRLNKVIFKGRTLDEVKTMKNFPWNIPIDVMEFE